MRDEEPRLSLDVGSIPVSPAWLTCGWIRYNSSTIHPQNMLFYLQPYILGKRHNPIPYMGVTRRDNKAGPKDLSTWSATYPQIIVGYPQKACLNKHF